MSLPPAASVEISKQGPRFSARRAIAAYPSRFAGSAKETMGLLPYHRFNIGDLVTYEGEQAMQLRGDEYTLVVNPGGTDWVGVILEHVGWVDTQDTHDDRYLCNIHTEPAYVVQFGRYTVEPVPEERLNFLAPTRKDRAYG